jgi:hypothetical protein
MMPEAKDKSFFVGFDNNVPRPLAGFALRVAALLIGGFAMLAFVLGGGGEDPGPGIYGDEIVVQGELHAKPYPFLRVAADRDHPAGRAILLAGDGKVGAEGDAAPLDGQQVVAKGAALKRGTLDMMVIGSGGFSMSAAPASASVPAQASVSRGTWRLSGEICDGKCLGGAMRPGTGLAHKACANLCISGGQPPVFASTGTVDGTSFFLLADRNGGPVPDAVYHLVALPVDLEGEVQRIDNMLIFKVDWEKLARR